MEAIQPIGLFDSGVGGITIWKEIHRMLPMEHTMYLADSKNAPYGQKSKEDIISLSVKNTEFLLNNNAKIIVVACNTATTNAIQYLREHFDVPFIGIEPAIKPAALHSKTGVIGVLATKGTLTSDLFHKAVKTHQNVKIIDQIGFGLVSLIEQGKIHSQEMTDLLKEYLAPMVAQKMDHLVLGCTHYPFLADQISAIIPDDIKIIDSGEAVAKQTRHILEKSNLINTEGLSKHLFYTNIDTAVLSSLIPDQKNVFQLDF